MRVPSLPVLIILLLGIAVDVFIYRSCLRRKSVSGWWRGVYISTAALFALDLGLIICAPKREVSDTALLTLMWMLFAYMSVYVPKILLALVLGVRALLTKLLHRRLCWLKKAGIALAVSLFGLMWWGALVNRYNIDVKQVEVRIPRLPQSFDGYRIVQISDLHTGSYASDCDFVAGVVDSINALHPDIVLFTGDIVNRGSHELEAFAPTLARIAAPGGVWSVMGNHDYSDYHYWPNDALKQADVAHLQRMQQAMGWKMLNNSHTVLRGSGNDSIVLIGVENIGDPPFKIFGSLERAYPPTGDSAVKILMSHNPRHWTDSIADNPAHNIALTLSGHTHAMQMEALGISPCALRYPTWGGAYTDSLGRTLYVNIGLGEVGFPARIGATPEITVITLRR